VPTHLRVVSPDLEGLRVDAAAAAGCGGWLFVDVDHTLLLDNSTECYLDLARPRWLVALVFDLLDALAPWRAWGGESEHWRDPLRVALVTSLLPLTLLRWRRQAKALAQRAINRDLLDALAGVDPRRVVVVSLGSAPLLRPLLAHTPLRASTLVASPIFFGATALRREGKLAILRRRFGASAIARSLAVTDAHSDADLLGAVAHPHLRIWPGDRRWRAQARSYYPLRYTHRIKYPHKAIVRRQLIGEDLAVACLAFAWWPAHGSAAWMASGHGLLTVLIGRTAAVVALWLSFFAVYELGYAENDRLGAVTERAPTLSTYARRSDRVRVGKGAWAWAIALGVVGVATWSWITAASPVASAAVGLAWAGVLATTRLVFAAFNRLPVHRRIYPFVGLQLLKSMGYAVAFAATLPGALLCLAQVFRQSTNYTIYRYRGDNRSFRRQGHRLVVFVAALLAASVAMHEAGVWLAPQTWVIAAFCLGRVGLEHRRFARFDVDARHRDYLEGRTDRRPAEV